MPNRFQLWLRRQLVGGITPTEQEIKQLAAVLQPLSANYGPTYATGSDFKTLVKEGYRRNELIYACIEKTAKSASQISIEMQDANENVVPAHPLLDLIHRPNDDMNESDFWAAIVIFQKLAGRAVFEIEYSRGGVPVALWPLNPAWLTVIQDERRPVVKEYIYKVHGALDDGVVLQPWQVVDFKLFDPLNKFTAYPPVAVCARAGDIDNAATDYIKMTWEHGGMPASVITTPQELIPEQVTAIRSQWQDRYGGFWNWLVPSILSYGATIARAGMTFTEMGFDVLDAREEARICMVLAVPPILVGAKVGLDRATYANYKEARSAWWEDDLVPMYNNFLDVIEYKLLPIYEQRPKAYSVGWDISGVYAFQEDYDKLWARALKGWDSGALTLNEFRALVGLPTLGPAGDIYKAKSEPAQEPDEEEDSEEEESDDGDDGGPGEKAANLPDDDAIRRRQERKLMAAAQKAFQAQRKRVEKDVRGRNGR